MGGGRVSLPVRLQWLAGAGRSAEVRTWSCDLIKQADHALF